MQCQMCDTDMAYLGAIYENSSPDPDTWRWTTDFYCTQCHSSLTIEHLDAGEYKSTWVVG